MIDSQITQQIDALKKSARWLELDQLYEKLSEHSDQLEQRLFIDWERSTLLSTELNQPAKAIKVLCKAALDGGPIDVIAPQIEAIRTATLTDLDCQKVAQESFQQLLKQAPLSRMSVQIQSWLQSIRLPSTLSQAPSMSTELETAQDLSESVDEAVDDSMDESILESIDIISEETINPRRFQQNQSSQPKQELLSAESTLLDPINPTVQHLNSQLADAEPLRFMNEFRTYFTHHNLANQDEEHFESLLWRAASKSGQWRLWVQIYEQIFLSGGYQAVSKADRTFKLASILEVELQDHHRAIELYSLILEHSPQHDEAFDRLRSLLKRTQDWDLLGKLLLEFAKNSKARWSIEERFEMCLEAGDYYIQHLNNSAKAITAWFQALELNAESKQIFVRLVEVYQKNKKWDACVKVLRKLSTLEEDQTKAAFHLYNIGLIQKDHLNDRYLAVRSFDEALDFDPKFMKAFQAIDDTLDSEEQDLGVVERRDRYYRKMLIRAVEHDFESSMIAELALQVGRLNGSILGRWTEAKQAFELVLDYEPMRDEAHLGLIRAIAEIEGPVHSIQSAFTWVRRRPQQAVTYRTLFAQAMLAQRWDHAWCAAITLEAMEQGDEETRHHLHMGRELLGAQFQRSISTPEWRLLEWSGYEWGGTGDEWGRLFSLLGRELLNLSASSPRSLGFHLKKDLIPSDESTLVGRIAHYVCQHLNLTRPMIWLNKPNDGALLTAVNLSDGYIGLAINREICEQLSIEELACTLTFGIILTQPSTILALSLQRDELLVDLKAAMIEVGLKHQFEPSMIQTTQPPNTKRLNLIKTLLSQLAQDQSSGLSELCRSLPSIDQWFTAIEQTAFRASLLISGDPRLVQLLMGGVKALLPNQELERRYKLLLFSVSPAYLKLREQLQLAWG